jgi:predicted site-specific integrase-resolvase
VAEVLVPIGEAPLRFPGLSRRTLDRWIAAGTIRRHAAPAGAKGLARTYVDLWEVEQAIKHARRGPKRPWRE